MTRTAPVLLILVLTVLACGTLPPVAVSPTPATRVIDPVPDQKQGVQATSTLGTVDYALVTAQTLNLRSCPATDCEVLAVLNYGQRVQVTGAAKWTDNAECDTWLPVRYFGQDGWICARWAQS